MIHRTQFRTSMYKKTMKNSLFALSALFIALQLHMYATLDGVYAQDQLRGFELYQEMGTPGFVQYEGSANIQWLPGDLGYLETEQVNGGTEFFAVAPESADRTPLFSKRQLRALLRGLEQEHGEDVEVLPFSSFDYVMENKAIFFVYKNQDHVFHLEDMTLRALYKPEVERAPYTEELMRQMETSQLWNGTYSHDYRWFAHVKGYDIYLVNTETQEEKRLTYGSEEQMNGRPSWVYPEEFGQRDAYWFSPDNKKIAYLQYNETDVYQYPIIHELEFETGLELERYPKAGEANPTVNLFIVDIETGEVQQVPTNSGPDTYIVRPIWRDNSEELTFRRFNRKQDYLEFLSYSLDAKEVRTIFTEREDAYINLHDNFYQLNDGEHFLWTSEQTGFNQLYVYHFDGSLVRQLTSGENPLGSIVRVDQKKSLVYYTAYHNMGLDEYFHVVSFDGESTQLSESDGRYTISMNEAAEYYVSRSSSFDRPYAASMHKADGSLIRNLQKMNVEKVMEQGLQAPEQVVFKAADGQTDLVGLVYKPADFDPTKTYPILLPLYGGPAYQDVTNGYKNADSYQRLAQLGYIVIRANYRGSGNRGKAFATLHYGKLGTLEIDDYAAFVAHISERSYADGARVGVYGHSYGGYATAMLLLRYPNLFHVGVSGAPVTDWRSYDTIYTERYMNTPQANKEGYDIGSAMTYADQLKGDLLIVHGTTDNNVHPQNSIMLIDALVRADKIFDVMFYPDNRHGIRGAHGAHYNKIRMRYLTERLQPEHAEIFLDSYNWSN